MQHCRGDDDVPSDAPHFHDAGDALDHTESPLSR